MFIYIYCHKILNRLKIAGYTIPKDWKILVWNRGVHMDPETYPNPMEFDPSRWDVCMMTINYFL